MAFNTMLNSISSKVKKALIIRLGAYGDMIIITPILSYLKNQGYHITLNTSNRGIEIFKHDNRIDKFIEHKEEISLDKIKEHWEKIKLDNPHNLFINFSESIECNVALHPMNPLYIYPKNSKLKWDRCNRNYYDVTIDWSKLDIEFGQRPSLQFTKQEEDKAKKLLDNKKFNILWCLSGSGKNKVYPWTDYVIGEVLKYWQDSHFITVGDTKCQILEDVAGTFPKDRITQLAGRISIRETLLATKYVDLVISPDTGVLHASGCYNTAKIGLLGHTTIENITKYFINDYSIESICECSPCFRLIYEYDLQCPIDRETKAAYCMANIKPYDLFNKIKDARNRAR